GYEYRHPSAWEKEQQRVKDELAAAQKQLADRERELASLRSSSGDALRSAQADLDRSKMRIAELERELASLRSGSGDALRSAQADLDQSKTRIAELERELASLRSSSGDALRSAQADLDQSKTRIAELERESASLRSGASDASKDAAGLASQLSVAQGELDQSKARSADLAQQLAASQTMVASLQAGAGDKDKLAADLAAANQRIAAMESQLASLQATSEDKRKLVAELEGKLAERDKELAGLRGELSAEMAKLKEAQRGLVRALRPQIEKGDITVDLNNERLLINLASGYLFGSGQDELKPAGADALKQVGAVLKDFPEYKVAVDGHTDNRPIRISLKKKFPTNKELSEARAATAAKALADGGLGNATTTGYADTKPVAPNTTDAGRAKNRRVEVRVTR
ncbi:MAG: OmpA family protein, partial [Nitrospirota bacterium]|nr:OmpA family protein [Nitrospirota bacterium]